MSSEKQKEETPKFVVGNYVNCSNGLGSILEIEENRARVYIHTFGCRWYNINDLTLHKNPVRV